MKKEFRVVREKRMLTKINKNDKFTEKNLNFLRDSILVKN